MTHTIIEVSLILGVIIGMVAYVGPHIAQPLLNETKCSIQNLEVFQITNTKYLIEMELLNNGDTEIINYSIRSSDRSISQHNVIIISGNYTTVEFTVSNIDGFLEVLVNTSHDSAICTSEMTI